MHQQHSSNNYYPGCFRILKLQVHWIFICLFTVFMDSYTNDCFLTYSYKYIHILKLHDAIYKNAELTTALRLKIPRQSTGWMRAQTETQRSAGPGLNHLCFVSLLTRERKESKWEHPQPLVYSYKQTKIPPAEAKAKSHDLHPALPQRWLEPVTWASLMPPRVCMSRKLESRAELGIEPRHAGCLNHWACPSICILRDGQSLMKYFQEHLLKFILPFF